MSGLRIRRWSMEELLASQRAWQTLLETSSADRLFMSWRWACSWWHQHAATLRGELCILAIYSTQGELVGVAPFYVRDAKHCGVLRVRRMELLGNTWRDPRGVFGEYLDVIARTELQDAVASAVAEWLRAASGWDELALCNLRRGSVAEGAVAKLQADVHVRLAEKLSGWHLLLPDSFETYAARLSSNTRRRAFNQRAKAVGMKFVDVPSHEQAAALARLEAFVARRFPAGTDDPGIRTRFHSDLVAKGIDSGTVRLTELRIADRQVSVMLNVRIGGTEYYLLSGFDPEHTNGLSPGLLHLGHALEAACRDRVRRFDFLAGQGRHRDYKQDFEPEETPLFTLHVVRRPLLRTLFKFADGVRGRTSHKARGEG